MNFKVKFSESNQSFRANFGEIIEVGNPVIVEGNFTENGTYNAKSEEAHGFNPVTVNVQPPLQNKTITENGTHTADGEYYGLGEVVVNVPPTADPRFSSLIDGTLTELIDDDITKIRNYAFYYSDLKKVCLPSVKEVESACFENSFVLHTAIFASAKNIGGSSFRSNYSLVSLILGYDAGFVKLAKTIAFSYCHHILGTTHINYNPSGAKDGFIYVPFSLVAQYRTATNWVTYATQIMPFVSTVEGLAEIDGTTYSHACVWTGGEEFTEYYFNGTEWEIFER